MVLAGFRNCYQFDVVRDERDREHPYKAWFFGWAAEDGNPRDPGCDAIYLARARDLRGPWEVYAGGAWDDGADPRAWVPVVTADARYYDEWHNGDPSVALVDGHYYMALSSTGHNLDHIPFGVEADVDGSILCVTGAVSDDGIHWRKSRRPLLLRPSDVGRPHVPEGESHLYGSCHRPALMREGGVWKLWFDYWAGRHDGVSLGYAENRGDFLDPAAWRILRGAEHPCLPNFPNPDIVRVRDLYFAYADPAGYEPHEWTGRKIAEAASLDGIEWTILGYVEPDDGVPATHVPQAFVTVERGRTWIYVFYACQRGGEPYDYRYESIRWMRREVPKAELSRLRRELLRLKAS